MVFHVTNYMRETNVWMIRKMRWIFWGVCCATPIYRNTYWDYLGRRVAWRDSLGFWGTEEEKKARAESLTANWGYHPRYEPVYDFSIKARKYSTQTDAERVYDTPRLNPTGNMSNKNHEVYQKDVRTFVEIVREHNREPGVFDYNQGQNFYSLYPEIDQEAYLVVGDRDSRDAHKSYQSGRILSSETKPY